MNNVQNAKLEVLKDQVSRSSLSSHQFDDDFLFAFLTARDLNVDLAIQLITYYVQNATKFPTLFGQFSESINSNYIKSANMCTSTCDPRLSSGGALVISRIGQWDLTMSSFDHFLASLINVFEHKTVDCAFNGFVYIIDVAGCSWSHLKAVKLALLRQFIDLIKNCMPIKVNHIIVVNCNLMFDGIWRLLKGFLKKADQDKVLFCRKDFNELHRLVPIELLPSELGGCNGHYGTVDYLSDILLVECELRKRWANGVANDRC